MLLPELRLQSGKALLGLCALCALSVSSVLASEGTRGQRCIDAVDVIEVNHFISPCSGEICLDQVIFWQFSPGLGRYVVRDWRTLKSPHQLPYRAGNQFRTCWHDGRDQNALRVVSARSVLETWTTYDPEQVNQELVDRNQRRGLVPVVPKRGSR